jgi:hypothetical protein
LYFPDGFFIGSRLTSSTESRNQGVRLEWHLLKPDSATTTECGLVAAQRNPGIGVTAEKFLPHFAALHAGYVQRLL